MSFLLIGASAGGGDLLGQMVAHEGLINPGSTIGAVTGGALGGAGSAVLAPFAAGTGLVAETVATGAISALTSGPGVYTTAIGSHLGEAVRNQKNNTERNTPDSKPRSRTQD